MPDLSVTVAELDLAANWTDENPGVRAAIADALPVAGDATRWGDELYFSIPVDRDNENPTEEVPDGAIAYWPGGNALCLFWGPTPASRESEPRAAAPVSVVARLEDVSPLAELDGGARVTVERS